MQGLAAALLRPARDIVACQPACVYNQLACADKHTACMDVLASRVACAFTATPVPTRQCASGMGLHKCILQPLVFQPSASERSGHLIPVVWECWLCAFGSVPQGCQRLMLHQQAITAAVAATPTTLYTALFHCQDAAMHMSVGPLNTCTHPPAMSGTCCTSCGG